MYSRWHAARSCAVFVLVALVCTASAGRASAFQILSSLTSPCHEQITLSVFECVGGTKWGGTGMPCGPSPLFPPIGISVDATVVGLADMFAGELGVQFDSDRTRLIALSLIAGARFPDIRGGSAYDLVQLRTMLLSDEHEHNHFVRRSYDDGQQGNDQAAAAAREFIEAELAAALQSAALPPAERFVSHTIAIDFYGEVEVQLYEPLYRLGVALHTFEDSFAHTLRSDDLSTILSVMNSIEALSGTLDEGRDGIAHSTAMDRCMEEGEPLAEKAVEAAGALSRAVALDAAGKGDGVAAVLDEWISVVQGCDMENDYCGTRWLDLARTDPFEPIIEMATGCGASAAGSATPLVLLLIPYVVFCSRRVR